MSRNFDETCNIQADQSTDDVSVIFFATVKSESENSASLDVERVWRGEVPKETWTWSEQLQVGDVDPDDGMVGESYLIYGTPNASVDGFSASTCVSRSTTIEQATLLLGAGSEPRDFVATFDEPFPLIDGSPLGITTNGYIVATGCFIFVTGILFGVLASAFMKRKS